MIEFMALRTPGEIVDTVAARHSYVTPLQEHMPLSPHMARDCAREAYADVQRLLQWAGGHPDRLKRVSELLAAASLPE